MRDIERAHQMHLDDGFEGVDAHAMEDRVAQDAGIVDDAVELAEAVDRHLDDLAGGNGFGDGLEIPHPTAPPPLFFLPPLLRPPRPPTPTPPPPPPAPSP